MALSALETTAVDLVPGRSGLESTFQGGLTVLMSVYGRDDVRFFERAVQSAFENTLPPDEFVLVVDGPVPAELEAAIQRVTFERALRTIWLAENGGLARALNRGLSEVRTEWVARADADDENLPDRFQKQATAVSALGGQVDMIGGAILEVDVSGIPIAIREVPLSPEGIARRLRTRNPFNHMTVVFRTAFVRAVGGYPKIHLREDYALWATMIAGGARCRNISDVVVRATTGRAMYRRRGGLRYARSEIDLLRHFYHLGSRSLASAVFVGILRGAVCFFPSGLRGLMYERLLRKRPLNLPGAPEA